MLFELGPTGDFEGPLELLRPIAGEQLDDADVRQRVGNGLWIIQALRELECAPAPFDRPFRILQMLVQVREVAVGHAQLVPGS